MPQDSQSVTVQAGQVATVEFSNILKKFTIELTKSDSEKGEAQGDATLEGAKYGLYKGKNSLTPIPRMKPVLLPQKNISAARIGPFGKSSQAMATS